MCWLALVTLCFTYNVSVIPLRGVFPYQTPSNVTYWLICDYLSDLVYLLDILVFKPRLTFLNSGLLEVCNFSAKLNSIVRSLLKFGLQTGRFLKLWDFFVERHETNQKELYEEKNV